MPHDIFTSASMEMFIIELTVHNPNHFSIHAGTWLLGLCGMALFHFNFSFKVWTEQRFVLNFISS